MNEYTLLEQIQDAHQAVINEAQVLEDINVQLLKYADELADNYVGSPSSGRNEGWYWQTCHARRCAERDLNMAKLRLAALQDQFDKLMAILNGTPC